MQNIFNQDFQDFIRSLNEAGVKYVLVGGYAVILHGHYRSTGDLDIWVEQSEENYIKILKAFQLFKMPVFDMTLSNFLENSEMDVFTFGKPPVSIDIMLSVKGLNFDETFNEAKFTNVEGLEVKVISFPALLKAKLTSGRLKDLDDIQNLKEEN